VVSCSESRGLQNILYGVAAITESDVWAVGAHQDSNGLWHTPTEQRDGSAWSVVSAVDAGLNGNQFYAVKALATNNVYAIGQQAGSGFPCEALVEHWDETAWSIVPSPADPEASALPLGITATASSLTLGRSAGDRHRLRRHLRGRGRAWRAVNSEHTEHQR
jgi:hypothetical protein